MKNKRFIALTMATLLGMTLTGCNKEVVEDTGSVVVKTNVNLLSFYIEEPAPKILEPGKHVFYKRYYSPYLSNNTLYNQAMFRVDSGSLDIPDGYRMAAPPNTVDFGGNNEPDAVDIWYENTETVLVNPVFNEDTNCYDYSTFGTIVDLTQENQKQLQGLSK